jgi:hypothetical protein
MPQRGRYEGGRQFVIIGSGVEVTGTTPASAEVSGTWRHGMEQIVNLDRLTDPLPAAVGPVTQGFDGRVPTNGGGGLAYDPDLNVDPGATGVPLVITTPCTLIKGVSADPPPDTSRTYLDRKTAVHFIDHTPAANSLPPPIGAVPHISRFVRADIDFDLLPNLSLPAYAGNAGALFAKLRWLQTTQFTSRSSGDWYTSRISEFGYGTQAAAFRAEAALMMCYDLSSISARLNEDLAIQFVVIGQDVFQAAQAGAVFNFNQGLGGVLPGYKLALVLAGLLTDDAEMLEYADPAQHNIWAEDVQTEYVTQGDVDNFDYIADDLGMPEWYHNFPKNLVHRGRSLDGLMNGGNNYKKVFRGHQFAQAAVLHMFPGGVTAWNHQPFFDYCERCARRTIYADPGSEVGWGLYNAGEYLPPTLHREAYLDNVAPGWDWPA